jgi:hypothetical protein
LFFAGRQTVGKLTAALALGGEHGALPTSDALILLSMAMVAAVAVVLALLTSPQEANAEESPTTKKLRPSRA